MNWMNLPECPNSSHPRTRSRIRFQIRARRGVESSWGVGTREVILFECPRCGLRFREPPSQSEIEEFYKSVYHEKMVGVADEERTRTYRLENLERIKALKRFCPNGSVLDVGCSRGHLASQLSEAGYDVFGADLSEDACSEAARLLGSDHVHCGPIEDLPAKFGERFDAVTLMDVIEHVEDVARSLRAIRDCLKEGGILFLRTPTLRSPFYKVADWSYFFTAGLYKGAVLRVYHAEHLYFFNETNLKQMLAEAGFEVLEISPDPLLWVNFRSAELRFDWGVNAALSAVYWLGRLFGRGHGMRVVARRLPDRGA